MPLEKSGPGGWRRDGGLRHGWQWNKSDGGEQANLTRPVVPGKPKGPFDAAANPEFPAAIVAVADGLFAFGPPLRARIFNRPVVFLPWLKIRHRCETLLRRGRLKVGKSGL